VAVDQTQGERDAELPDLDSAATRPWPHREFPIRNPGSGNVVQVVLKRSVLNAIHEHGLSQTDVEVCGVMVGQCYQDQRGPFVYIEEIIRGNHSDSQVAQVTFTAETWNHIQHEMDKRFEDKRILGWYHTHPGFGIFLSEMDMFIHENFFSENEQMAFVYDPIGGQAELFLWRSGRPVQDRYLVEEDSPETPGDVGSPAMPAVAAAGQIGIEDFDDRIRRIERRQRWLVVGLLLAVALAVISPFVAEYVAFPPWSSPPPDHDPDLQSPEAPIVPPAELVAPEPAGKKSPQESSRD
jgi:proteasome lid subunit RPN8/RPN11